MSQASDPDRTACSGWDHRSCEGTPYCPPRCPRFVDREGRSSLVVPLDEVDRDELVEMYVDFDSSDRSLGLPPNTRAAIETWLDGLVEHGVNFVALHDGRPVGHAVYAPVDASDPEFAIFVHQDAQRRGVGSELCRQAIAHAAENEPAALTLNVSRDNYGALRLYRQLGFESEAATDWEDYAVRMRLPLDRPVAERAVLAPARR